MDLPPVPDLYLKPGASVAFTPDGILKRMGDQEVAAYGVIERYAPLLTDDTVSIETPRLISYDPASQTGLLTNIGTFPGYSPSQYFGGSPIYTPAYTKLLHNVANIIRRTIPAEVVPDQSDYEAREADGISSVQYLKSGLKGAEPSKISDLVVSMADAAERTQDIIEGLPQLASHRDPNPNNIRVATHGNSCIVGLVDWETFGLSRVGYDEGRLMSYLALDEPAQEAYASQLPKTLPEKAEQVYFWRVAANRCIREAISFANGHYDSRLMAEGAQNVDTRRRLLVDRLSRLALRSLDALDRLS